jgi:hypothetical protein
MTRQGRLRPRTGLGPILALLAGLLLPAVAAAQLGDGGSGGDEPTGSSPGLAGVPPAVTPGTILDAGGDLGDMEIDGVLDEAAWAGARLFTEFTQGQPVEGDPAEHDTEVRVLFGDAAVWIGARMWDPEPGRIQARLTRRDNFGSFDQFGVMFDPNLDGLTGYGFLVSAANVQTDMYLYDDDRQDQNWDAVWASAVTIDEQGWTAEIRVPLAQLRYESSSEPQTWGVNFFRRRIASNEESWYALVSRLRTGTVSQMSRLDNVVVDRSARRLELVPYAVSSLHSGPSEDGDPFFDGTAANGRVGVDLSYGLGAAFTLDATINPDFGQVEADPAVINLSAFETFFDERRPFFVEDARVFDFTLSGGRNQLFYSRRVGRAPQGGAPSGTDFTDVPDNATILGAAKIAGRTTNGVSIGALAAVTGSEHGEALFTDGSRGDFLVEPRSEYGTVSVAKDFRGGASQIGVLGTAMHRALPSDGSFDWLSSTAYSGGVRFNHQWDDRNWAVFGYVSGSHVRGDAEAITRIQRSSIHYYQRTDATRFAVDSAATSIGGRDWRVTLAKQNGEHWTWSLWAAEVSKGFEVNDLGFSTRSEVLDGGTRLTYREIQPGRVFRNYNIGVSTFHNWSHDALDDAWSIDSWNNAHTSGNYSFNAFGQFLNYWGVGTNLSVSPERMDRRATRGGPMMVSPPSMNWNVNVNTDRRKAVSMGMFFGLNDERVGRGGGWNLGSFLNLQPSDNVSISLEPRFGTSRSSDQYVTATSVLPHAPTYGRRYIFADLDQRTFEMGTRLDWTFTPTLSLQLFAQPLLSSADYVTYKQLAAAQTYDFIDLGPSDPSGTQSADFDNDGTADFTFTDRDFNFRSLVGNAVLRWEYRPGSAIFLVWQRAQSHSASVGDFDFGRDLGELFDAPTDDRFILKINYWLGL